MPMFHQDFAARSSRLFVGACVLLYLLISAGWIAVPFPAEYREWAQAEAALRLFDADGAYSSPDGNGIYVYGFLFPLLGNLLHRLFSADMLLLLRTLSLGFTVLSATLAVVAVRRRSAAGFDAQLMCFAIVVLCGWQNVPGVAVPAPMGTALMLCALLAAERERVGWSALATSLLFFVKPYFVALWLPLQLWFFMRSRRLGWRYLVLTLACGLAVGGAVLLAFPYYYIYNIVHHLAAASSDVVHLLRQLVLTLVLFLPLFVGTAMAARRMGRAFFRDVYALSGLLLFALWLRLGMHTGGNMSYVLHLWLPVVGVFVFSWNENIQEGAEERDARTRRNDKRMRALFSLYPVLAIGFLLGVRGYNPLPPMGEERVEWEALNRELRESANDLRTKNADGAICISPAAAPMAARCGMRVADGGMRQYAGTLYSEKPWVQALLPQTKAFARRAETSDARVLDLPSGASPSVVVADTWSIVAPEDLRGLGYKEKCTHNVRVGVHNVGVSVWIRN